MSGMDAYSNTQYFNNGDTVIKTSSGERVLYGAFNIVMSPRAEGIKGIPHSKLQLQYVPWPAFQRVVVYADRVDWVFKGSCDCGGNFYVTKTKPRTCNLQCTACDGYGIKDGAVISVVLDITEPSDLEATVTDYYNLQNDLAMWARQSGIRVKTPIGPVYELEIPRVEFKTRTRYQMHVDESSKYYTRKSHTRSDGSEITVLRSLVYYDEYRAFLKEVLMKQRGLYVEPKEVKNTEGTSDIDIDINPFVGNGGNASGHWSDNRGYSAAGLKEVV